MIGPLGGGATIDEITMVAIEEALLAGIGGGATTVAPIFDISASTPPTQDTSVECNAVSATFVIGGVAQ